MLHDDKPQTAWCGTCKLNHNKCIDFHLQLHAHAGHSHLVQQALSILGGAHSICCSEKELLGLRGAITLHLEACFHDMASTLMNRQKDEVFNVAQQLGRNGVRIGGAAQEQGAL